ncbi:MAG: EF-P 5-aminopentanol modification-associated protein YfmF [Acutalibacteraceae bacterium]
MNNAEKLTISNGVEAAWYDASKFKKSVVSVSMYLPLECERTTLIRLVSGIITQKTHDYQSYTELNARLNELYGASISAGTIAIGDMQCTTFKAVCLDDKYANGEQILANVTKLLCEMLFNPVMTDGLFDTDAFESEKRLLCETINAQLNDKQAYATQRLCESMYIDEPCGYSTLSSLKVAESATNAQAVDAYNYMMQNAFVRINVLSAKPHEEIFDTFKAHFDKLNRNVQKHDISKRHICQNKQPNIVSEQMEVTQGKLCMGFTADSGNGLHNDAVMRVFCDIFGGGPYSLLFSNVREKQSLCYYCSSRFNLAKGTLYVASGILPENYDKAYNGILAELDKIKSGEIDETLLETSKKSLLDSYLSVSDSLLSIDTWYYTRVFRNDVSLDGFCKEIATVTLDDVLNLAKTVKLDTVFHLTAKEEN